MPTEPSADRAFDQLRLIPDIDISYDGDCAQAIGIDLPVAVINLAHRTDKWDAVSSRMASVGLDKLIKVPAIEGAKLALDGIAPILAQPFDVIEAAPRSHFTLTRPAIGCYLSHLAVWKWMLANNLPRVLVFEDDAYPVANFDPTRFRRIMQSMPDDNGMVMLGRIIMNGMADIANGDDLARVYFFNGTFAYLMTPGGCRSLLPHILPLDGHIDHQISTALIRQRNEIAAHYVEPAFFEPDWSLRSDCYVPLENEDNANDALGALLKGSRRLLLEEGRPLQDGVI